MILTAEQYAVFEQVKGLVGARRGKRVSREVAFAEMARLALAPADNHSRVRHRVIVHVDADSGEGFYDTDRGPLPAELPAIEEAMKSATILVASSDKRLPAGSAVARPAGDADPKPLMLGKRCADGVLVAADRFGVTLTVSG